MQVYQAWCKNVLFSTIMCVIYSSHKDCPRRPALPPGEYMQVYQMYSLSPCSNSRKVFPLSLPCPGEYMQVYQALKRALGNEKGMMSKIDELERILAVVGPGDVAVDEEAFGTAVGRLAVRGGGASGGGAGGMGLVPGPFGAASKGAGGSGGGGAGGLGAGGLAGPFGGLMGGRSNSAGVGKGAGEKGGKGGLGGSFGRVGSGVGGRRRAGSEAGTGTGEGAAGQVQTQGREGAEGEAAS